MSEKHPGPTELVEPFDEHNRKLLANVHPEDWTNPEPADRYQLVVIGAGTAGLISAAGAAGLGAKVALIERNLMGGDCLNVGCVPSKGVIRAARAWHDARNARAEFGGPEATGPGDFSVAMERMRKLRAGISGHDSAQRFSDLGIDVFLGQGRFVASDAIEVGGARLRFRRAIIATGARASAPPIPGLDQVDYLTNETLFNLRQLPQRLGVIGAGPIGCEIAQTFARMGSRVHLTEAMHGVLPNEDPDAAKILEKRLLDEGVKLLCCGKDTKISRNDDGSIRVTLESHDDNYDLSFDQLLVSVGRRPNTDGLGLEAAGVEYSKHGVTVDDRLRTSNRRVYAVGDIASRYKFTHMADALARIAIQNSLFFGRRKASDLVVPWATYTSPEIAHVGIYPREAEKEGIEMDTIDIGFDQVDRAILDGETDGFARIHVEKGSDKILGATIVAEHAGDLISEVTLAMTQGIGMEGLSGTIHPYPTQAEVLRKAADTWRRGKLTPTVKKIFAIFFRIFR